jgi:hypothetical protein
MDCEAALVLRHRGQPAQLSQRRLNERAERVFIVVQAAFRYFEKRPPTEHDRPIVAALWKAQNVASRAAFPLLKAKLLQIRAGRGRPLTVCIGDFVRRLPPELESELDMNARLDRHAQAIGSPDQTPHDVGRLSFFTYGDGCGRIIEDATSKARPAFRGSCERCGKRTTARREAHISRIRAAWGEPPALSCVRYGPDGPVTIYLRHCVPCGELFKTTTAQRRKCQQNCGGS